MRVEITMQPLFWLALTREELEPLFLLASHHYDGACQAAARQGGFMYGWRNIVSSRLPAPEAELPLCSGTRRDLDTVLKICEGTRLAVRAGLLTKEQGALADRVCVGLWAALKEATSIGHDVGTIKVREPTLQDEWEWTTNPGRM